ncbi:flagellar basal body rod C-terminal domain-containing protein [Moritella sp. F3]|uniref:FlgK family flagellar hook-associated protein n=1 Tax=Moritella sp. F3 TaxID=2718882 RepID=UPI0018E115BD|nr:flagellar basal body rod C-terminal domain-containing protein [Moritella sp. F3]GIC76603.1 flagellar hook protein FlgK [Moritella sp. F1]GIC81644.1 flagellar hook protein FlgK [Moritella sp. F3]
MANLLQIGTSGVLGHQQMLQTTGNNISNVNTDGYSRQRTQHNSQTDNMGLARSVTGREVDKFAQAELLIDTSAFGNKEKFLAEITRTDQVLSDKSNNMAAGVSQLFESFHTANDDPTSISNRQLAVTDAKTLAASFRNVGEQLNNQAQTANSEIAEKPALLNSLIQDVHGLNKQVMIADGTSRGASGTLLDQRDVAIESLAKELDISTIVNDNKSISINLLNGQPLVMQNNVSQFSTVTGDPESNNVELVLNIDKNTMPLQNTNLGGRIGALLEFRDETVYSSLREIGQLSLGIADAVNSQNKMGLDLNGNMGKDIYTIPPTQAKHFSDNSNPAHVINSKMIAGEGSSLTTSQYQISMTSPMTFDIFEIKNGERSTNPLAVNGAYPGPVEVTDHGFEVDFSAAAGGFQSGDKFLMSPTLFNLDDYDIINTQPEDIALASILQTKTGVTNTTMSRLAVTEISDASLSFSNNDLSLTAPQQITVNNSGDFDIFDGNGTYMATSSGALNGQNLFSNAVPPLNPGVGYEIKMDGKPNPGESFTLAYNRDSIADNSNGLRLAGLENDDKLRKNHNNNGENQMTFAEGIATLISTVGNQTRAARVDSSANQAKLIQSQNWVESVSGVNLDEEAANMVRYEQAYNASAQVVNISKEIFDTILNAAR